MKNFRNRLSVEDTNAEIIKMNLESLSEAELNFILSHSRNISYSKNDVIVQDGSTIDSVYILKKGIAKSNKLSSSGKEIISKLIYPYIMIGLEDLFTEEKPSFGVIALQAKTEVIAIPKNIFLEVIKKNPAISMDVMKIMNNRIKEYEEKLETIILKDAKSRVIQFLLNSAKKIGRKIGSEILVSQPLTQQDIANITGTSRQTVTMILNELRKTNQIHMRRNHILIRDIDTLEIAV